jgi:hypothetical protein
MNNKKIHIYIDESGDTGVKFDKGSSEFLVVSLLCIKNDYQIKTEKILKNIIDSLNIYPKELKFSDTSFKNKDLFFSKVKDLDFIAYIFVFKKNTKQDFYYFIKHSLENMNIEPHTRYMITIDGVDGNKFTGSNIRNIKTLFKKTTVNFLDSRKSIFLQLSDMLAGLVHSFYRNKKDYEKILRLLKDKIKITQIE